MNALSGVPPPTPIVQRGRESRSLDVKPGWPFAHRVLAYILIVTLIGWTQPGWPGGSAAALTNGLVAAYAFSEGTGLTVADLSGNGHTGSLKGATWTNTGKYGKTLSFNGSTTYVDLGNAAD